MRSPRFHGASPRPHSKPPRGRIGSHHRPPVHHRPPLFRPGHRLRHHRGRSCLGCTVWLLGALAMLALLIAAIL